MQALNGLNLAAASLPSSALLLFGTLPPMLRSCQTGGWGGGAGGGGGTRGNGASLPNKKLQVVAEAGALASYTRCEAHTASRRGRCEVGAVATS